VDDPRRFDLEKQVQEGPDDQVYDEDDCWKLYEIFHNTIHLTPTYRGHNVKTTPEGRPRASAFDKLNRGSTFDRLVPIGDL